MGRARCWCTQPILVFSNTFRDEKQSALTIMHLVHNRTHCFVGGCDMLKSMLFRLWLMGFAALIAMLTPGAAVAEPIIVIISSQHNLEYARRACSSVANPEGIAECKFVGDGRHLGRKLENEVRSGMATSLGRIIPPACWLRGQCRSLECRHAALGRRLCSVRAGNSPSWPY